ncbi:hypothetical protein I317_07998, partial [Kwoniella heveanensis CBS 569]
MPVVLPMDDLRSRERASSSQSNGTGSIAGSASGRLAAPAGQVEKKASSALPNGNGNGNNGANGNGSGSSNSKDKGWIEGVDYAYEYVPVTQRRQGRKN